MVALGKHPDMPVAPGSIHMEGGVPVGVVIDTPAWDPARNAAILKDGRLCKRCLKRGKSDGCWQHRAQSGAEVRIAFQPGLVVKGEDGRIGTLMESGEMMWNG